MNSVYLAAAFIVLSVILVFSRQKKYGLKTVIITGLPRTNKTKLFQFIISGQIPQTFKSAFPTTFIGIILNRTTPISITDVPSDTRKVTKHADIAIVPIRDFSLEQAKQIANTIISCDRVIVLSKSETEFVKLICAETAKLQGIEYVEELQQLEFLNCCCSDDKWDCEMLLAEIRQF